MEAPNNFAVAMFLRAQRRHLGNRHSIEEIYEMYERALPWGVDKLYILGLMRASSAKQLALAAGFRSMDHLGGYTGNSRQTLNNWFRDKPINFDYVLLGAYTIRHAATI